ncbi:hypothetical protein EK904_002050 [Melospiza melodia maxima]|nr:hypothetical protein EK904_002050 [Melospiza melodia maxima]
MEELVSNQKPPSAEAKVVKAQLEEQKLLKRLLEERRPRVELVLQDRLMAPEGSAGLFSLGERWDKLMKEAEARWVRGQVLITELASTSCWHRLCPLVSHTRGLCDTLMSLCSAPLALGPP